MMASQTPATATTGDLADPTLTSAAAPPGIACTQQTYHGQYVGVANCYIRSASWTYYQAYVTQDDAYECGGRSKTTATFRMQVLARRGATGVHIAGVWVVYLDGPRRFGTLQFSATDGNNADKNGAWNYNGNYSRYDIADLYSNGSDPIRYPGVSPSHYVGMAWGRIGTAKFEGQWRVANHAAPYSSQGTCGFRPVRVMFRP